MDKRTQTMHIVSMKRITRRIDSAEVGSWVTSVGGVRKATWLIGETLECSLSKAEKIASGRYPSLPTLAEQVALATLMQRQRDVLFPLVAARGRSRAS